MGTEEDEFAAHLSAFASANYIYETGLCQADPYLVTIFADSFEYDLLGKSLESEQRRRVAAKLITTSTNAAVTLATMRNVGCLSFYSMTTPTEFPLKLRFLMI